MHEQYSYKVWWSEEDQEYVATCTESPSLSWLEENREDAIQGIHALVREVLEDMQRNGELIPQPLSSISTSSR